MDLKRCIFEILGKLAVSQLTAVCNFVDSKIKFLELTLNKYLAFTNIFQDSFNFIEQKLRIGDKMFQDAIQSSALLNVAKSLGPSCGSVADVFQGALDVADFIKTGTNDLEYAARQIMTVNGIINTVKNEIIETTSGLRDLCNIVQIMVLEKTRGNDQLFTKFDQRIQKIGNLK